MPKGRDLVDDEMDAWDYADRYVEEEAWQERKRIAKESGEEVEPARAGAAAKQKPQPKPQAAEKPKPQPQPQPQPQPKPEVAAPTPEDDLEEPVLEAVDDWEAAMDALEAYGSKQEEIRAKETTQKGGKK